MSRKASAERKTGLRAAGTALNGDISSVVDTLPTDGSLLTQISQAAFFRQPAALTGECRRLPEGGPAEISKVQNWFAAVR